MLGRVARAQRRLPSLKRPSPHLKDGAGAARRVKGLNGSYKLHLVVDSPLREEEFQWGAECCPPDRPDFAIHSPVSSEMNRQAS